MSATARASRILVVGIGGTALLFALMAWQSDKPDDTLLIDLFFIGAPVLGCLVAFAASGRAKWLLLGVGIFFVSSVVMAVWMGTAVSEGGGYFVATWFALETVALYSTAALIAFMRVPRE